MKSALENPLTDTSAQFTKMGMKLSPDEVAMLNEIEGVRPRRPLTESFSELGEEAMSNPDPLIQDLAARFGLK